VLAIGSRFILNLAYDIVLFRAKSRPRQDAPQDNSQSDREKKRPPTPAVSKFIEHTRRRRKATEAMP
jgi:hypothetical protein